MAWELDNGRPIYSQIVERIERQIISGYYKPADKLPSVRDLAADAGVNPNTMQKALSELERMGLIVTIRTSGRTVTEDVSMLDKVKQDVAKEQIKYFIENMRELGYDVKDIMNLLEKVNEEER